MEHAAAGRRPRAPTAPGPPPPRRCKGLLAVSTPRRCGRLARGQRLRGRCRATREAPRKQAPELGSCRFLDPSVHPPTQDKLWAGLGLLYFSPAPPPTLPLLCQFLDPSLMN